ncbi:MAG: dienelactone hydrolase family protein [Anaerolineales bacterium]|nr:dienelactone hydrolase family protein [Anaerolineales bacterium]NUQ85235.1 dienelactone hydrolase family protein [Anaerolineales bacterium]
MNLFQRYLADEFAEDYEEGRLSRREALKLIASVTGSLVAANSILAACAPPPEAAETGGISPTDAPNPEPPPASDSPTPESAPTEPAFPEDSSATAHGTVMPDDPAILAGEIEFPGTDANIMGYLSRPSNEIPAPIILVCHENRGLTPHIRDVTRRFAKAGYVSLAVDLLSRLGGSAAVGEGNVPGALSSIDPMQFVDDFKSGWLYLGEQPFADARRVGMTGFCFGGGVTWQVAVNTPELLAAIPYYGPHPLVSDVPKINAAVLAIYGELDSRINSGISVIEEAMAANNKIYEKVIYPNANHAFNNDTGSRYDPSAAQDAWMRSLDWFERYVRNV